MAKGDAAAEAPAVLTAEEIIDKWFQDTFYNRALDTEFFNYIMTAKDELKERFKGGV